MTAGDTNGNGVRVTLRDVYEEVKGLRSEVQSALALSAENEKDIGDHEHRLRDVEKWKYALPPTSLLAIASILVAVFT